MFKRRFRREEAKRKRRRRGVTIRHDGDPERTEDYRKRTRARLSGRSFDNGARLTGCSTSRARERVGSTRQEGLRGGQVRKRRRVRSPGRAREQVKPKERADERRWSAGNARLACAGLRTRYSTRCYKRSARVEQPSPAVVATPDTTRMLSSSERLFRRRAPAPRRSMREVGELDASTRCYLTGKNTKRS